jgi:ketosteroid isomerase-like protein
MLFSACQTNDTRDPKGSFPMLRKISALAVVLLASSITFAKDAFADEQAIRALDTAWSHAETKDLDKTVSFYADDASILPPNMPIATGKNAIRAVWSQFMSMPGFSITFAPSKVVIAKSETWAYEIGTFETTVDDAQGMPTSSVGKFVVNWQKRDGQWKVVTGIFNDDK